LDFLGFPWILSSETKLINGLRGTSDKGFFLAPLPFSERGIALIEALCGIAHGATIADILVFRKQLSAIVGSYGVRWWSRNSALDRHGRPCAALFAYPDGTVFSWMVRAGQRKARP
jgi:hypothetical protein